MYTNLTWNYRVCVGVTFLWLLCACLPSLTTLEWINQQHFAKTKVGYISLPSNLHAIIGITSYCCVLLKMVILHDAIKTIQNGVFVLFLITKTCFSSKKKNGFEETAGLSFKENGFFSTLIIFQSFVVVLPWSHNLEQDTSLSASLGVRRTPRV